MTLGYQRGGNGLAGSGMAKVCMRCKMGQGEPHFLCQDVTWKQHAFLCSQSLPNNSVLYPTFNRQTLLDIAQRTCQEGIIPGVCCWCDVCCCITLLIAPTNELLSDDIDIGDCIVDTLILKRSIDAVLPKGTACVVTYDAEQCEQCDGE